LLLGFLAGWVTHVFVVRKSQHENLPGQPRES
jgi:hypothetical protein